jgi:hypothetical protein
LIAPSASPAAAGLNKITVRGPRYDRHFAAAGLNKVTVRAGPATLFTRGGRPGHGQIANPYQSAEISCAAASSSLS